jgi:hypothetical protein
VARLQLTNSIEVTDILDNTSQADSSACVPRFGKVISLHPTLGDRLYVEFDGLALGTSVLAKIGRQFRKSELETAIENGLTCRIEFLNSDLSLPVLTDIFFSLLDDDQPMILRAKSLIIETEDELILKSGETKTRYSGRDGRVTTNAKYITSQAEKAQKIQGSTIAIN